jgi:hypothetical protein
MYLLFSQREGLSPRLPLVVRSQREPEALIPDVRAAIAE